MHIDVIGAGLRRFLNLLDVLFSIGTTQHGFGNSVLAEALRRFFEVLRQL
jgi:hypothetical protein